MPSSTCINNVYTSNLTKINKKIKILFLTKKNSKSQIGLYDNKINSIICKYEYCTYELGATVSEYKLF